MKKKFAWERWRDPLLSDYEEDGWPCEEDESGNPIPIHSIERQPVMHTPHGMLSVVDASMACTSFDFWIMHTNFGITNKIAAIIEAVDGVESIEVYTRYRARLGFPKSGLFNSQDVRYAIEEAVRDMSNEEQNQLLVGLELSVAERVIEMRKDIDKKFEHWAIYVVPNGNLEVVGSDTMDEHYKDKVSLLKECQESVGGRLLTSEERE